MYPLWVYSQTRLLLCMSPPQVVCFSRSLTAPACVLRSLSHSLCFIRLFLSLPLADCFCVSFSSFLRSLSVLSPSILLHPLCLSLLLSHFASNTRDVPWEDLPAWAWLGQCRFPTQQGIWSRTGPKHKLESRDPSVASPHILSHSPCNRASQNRRNWARWTETRPALGLVDRPDQHYEGSGAGEPRCTSILEMSWTISVLCCTPANPLPSSAAGLQNGGINPSTCLASTPIHAPWLA